MATIRIGTRASELALWQAHRVGALLRGVDPSLEVELVPITTEGDRRLDVPLAEIGGKGVFATEVQRLVLNGDADIAVHSAKDLPSQSPEGLVIGAIPERGDVRDALVGGRLAELPLGATVATGSARRRALLADARPDLRFAELRGNMATRIAKAADFDAIVVAGVALERLGLADRIDDYLDPIGFIPQVAQAALAVECRTADDSAVSLLSLIDDSDSRRRVEAEREFLVELGGDCSLPAGAHAVVADDNTLLIRGVLASEPGVRVERGQVSSADSDNPGRDLAVELRDRLENPTLGG